MQSLTGQNYSNDEASRPMIAIIFCPSVKNEATNKPKNVYFDKCITTTILAKRSVMCTYYTADVSTLTWGFLASNIPARLSQQPTLEIMSTKTAAGNRYLVHSAVPAPEISRIHQPGDTAISQKPVAATARLRTADIRWRY